jgi:hypothetical protein
MIFQRTFCWEFSKDLMLTTFNEFVVDQWFSKNFDDFERICCWWYSKDLMLTICNWENLLLINISLFCQIILHLFSSQFLIFLYSHHIPAIFFHENVLKQFSQKNSSLREFLFLFVEILISSPYSIAWNRIFT